MKTNDKKILFYKGKTELFYSCFSAEMTKSHNKNDRPFFPVAGLQQLMETLFCKTWMATENCPLFFCKDTYNLSKFVVNTLHFLKLYHCCTSWLLVIYFLSFTFQFFNCYNTTIIEIRGHSQIENSVLNVDPKSEFWLPPPNLDANVYFWPQQSSTFVLLLTLTH